MMHSRKLRRRAAAIGVVLATLVAGSMAMVAPAGAATAGVTVVSTMNPSVTGQRISLRVSVSDPVVPPAGVSGTATILDGPTLLATVTVTGGKASYVTNALTAGSHSISASFAPTGGGPALVSSPIVQTVNAASTTTSLATSRPTAKYGDVGTITATVKAVAPGSGVPTGSVDFFVDGGWFMSSPVGSGGKATMSLADLYPSLYPGTYSITASYSGEPGYDPSTSAAVAQTITGLATAPVTTLALNAGGRPVFTPRSFTLSSVSPVGCNIILTNNTPTAQVLVYGTPGTWKRLPGGVVAAGASTSLGVGIGNYTGYFSTMANTNNYVAIRCV